MINPPPPYRPLRGAEPPHFVDRNDEDDFTGAGIVAGSLNAYRTGPADPRFHRLVYSGACMGKTALLRAIGGQVADRLGWATAYYRCLPKQRVLGALGQNVASALSERWPDLDGGRRAAIAHHPSATAHRPSTLLRGGAPSAMSQAWGQQTWGQQGTALRVLAPPGDLSWARLSQVMRASGYFCLSISKGLLVTLDDADNLARGEVEAIGHLGRALAKEGLPVAFLLGGSHLLADSAARAGNFSDSLWPTRLGPLDNCEAREAVVVPAADRGMDLDDGAVELICHVAGGCPLDLQRLAFVAWSLGAASGTISLADAEKAVTTTCSAAERQAS